MRELPDSSIDMILCDLPYGTTDCSWDVVIPFEPLWSQYKRIIKGNGAVVLFSAQPFTTDLINSNRRNYRYSWYWKKNNKTGALNCKRQPLRCVEDISVFYCKQPVYNPQGLIRLDKPVLNKADNKTPLWRGKKNDSLQLYTNYPNHLLEFAKDPDHMHPTQKPVSLLEYLIRTYTDEGDTVLDNCMGSGSTGVACLNAKRRFIGMEADEKYFRIAQERLEIFQNQL